jgi:hypothetical protein
MAWLWKQGRPTLLAMVGAGVLGYKAFHRGRAPEGQRPAAVGVWDAPPAQPPRTTPAPAAVSTQTGFLGGLSLKELVTRVIKEVREDDCLGWAAQLAYYLNDREVLAGKGLGHLGEERLHQGTHRLHLHLPIEDDPQLVVFIEHRFINGLIAGIGLPQPV